MAGPAAIRTVLRADAMWTPGGPVADAELEFEGDRIVYAGSRRTEGPGSAGTNTGTVTHDLAGHVLMPGLVNGHTHAGMTLMRGISDDDGFMTWLAAVQQREQGFTRDDIEQGLRLAMREMIATGTVAFADMYYWDEGLIEAVREAGMRVFASPATFAPETVGFPGVSPATGAEVTADTEQLAARYARDPQVLIGYGPHAPYTCPPEFLRDIGERAARLGIPIHTHIAESRAEIETLRERYGATPVEHLEALGLFGARVHAAHCVHLDPRDPEFLADAGASVSHNPVSNLKLGCGVAPLPELVAAGVPLALGTDSAASNNSLDLFEEIKLAALLHRGVREDAATVTAAQVLDIATRGGAAAIGFPESGALEAGRLADVIALDVTGPNAAPHDFARDPEALAWHLVFSASGTDVRHVFIGGRKVY